MCAISLPIRPTSPNPIRSRTSPSFIPTCCSEKGEVAHMPTQILMPALSPTMEEGNLSKWLKKEGDTVSPGDVIAEIETDKATMEVEAVDEGTLGKILVEEGAQGVRVNTPIALLLAEGESADDLEKGASTPPPAQAQAPAEEHAEQKAEDLPAPAVVPKAATQPMPSDPDIPEGTEMVKMTVRAALRDAMAEGMRRDPDVFVMGEEVAEYQGDYKITQGLLQEFDDRRVIEIPIS